MSGFEIEKNVPIPNLMRGRNGICPYPFDDMEHGDSFFMAVQSQQKAQKDRKHAYAWGSKWKKRLSITDVQIITRIVVEDEVLGVRVWLVKKDKSDGR